MSMAKATVCLSFDFDAMSVWIGPRDATSPSAISRGEFAVVGVERILKVLASRGIAATFFIPGHTVETYPGSVEAILAAGHEIGHHGYLHENPCALPSRDEERRVLERGLQALASVAQLKPTGYRSPSWDNSPYTIDLLLEYGFRYESSLMADERAYELLQDGAPTGLVELPVEWILDDAPLFDPRGERYSPPREVAKVWIDEFDKAYEEGTMFVLTMHPHISGHRSRIVALEMLIAHIQSKGAGRVWWATHGDVAEYVRKEAKLGEPLPRGGRPAQ